MAAQQLAVLAVTEHQAGTRAVGSADGGIAVGGVGGNGGSGGNATGGPGGDASGGPAGVAGNANSSALRHNRARPLVDTR